MAGRLAWWEWLLVPATVPMALLVTGGLFIGAGVLIVVDAVIERGGGIGLANRVEASILWYRWGVWSPGIWGNPPKPTTWKEQTQCHQPLASPSNKS